MKLLALATLAIVFTISPGYGQWFGRASNTVGNWRASSDNRGVVFNDNLAGGGSWNGTNLVFGAGLWIGGMINCPFCKRAPVAMTVSFDPNSGASDFVAGSAIYDGDAADNSGLSVGKYMPVLSSSLSPSFWPIRAVSGNEIYVDGVEQRATTGIASYLGEEDIFTIYKNTDTTIRDLTTNVERVPRFEIRTQMGFWGKSIGRDIVVVRNQLIYLGTDTLLDPTVALAIDGDIGSGGSATANNSMRGFLDSGVQGCFFRSGPNVKPELPLLGVYVLRGTSGSGRSDLGLTTLRRWTIQNDPITSPGRYDFMTSTIADVIDSGKTGDMRALLASTSQAVLLPGDTMHFDYAIGAVAPSGSSAVDTENIIDLGRMITSLYKRGSLVSLSIPSRSIPDIGYEVRPNPSTSSCTINSLSEEIRRIDVLNVLGKSVRTVICEAGSTSAIIELDGLPAGMYYARVNGQAFVKVLKQ